MPTNLKEQITFNILMVIVMVYALVCYNMSFEMGGLNNNIFSLALIELPIMGTIAFILEMLFVGKISKKITFSLLNPKETQPIFITIFISSIIVCFMCPLMSFFATILFNFNGLDFLFSTWLTLCVRNFPMALLFQIFFAGPFVRFLFKKIFKK